MNRLKEIKELKETAQRLALEITNRRWYNMRELCSIYNGIGAELVPRLAQGLHLGAPSVSGGRGLHSRYRMARVRRLGGEIQPVQRQVQTQWPRRRQRPLRLVESHALRRDAAGAALRLPLPALRLEGLVHAMRLRGLPPAVRADGLSRRGSRE